MLYTREEAIARFDIADINPTAGAVPYSKLDWMNGLYIRNMPVDELQRRLAPYLAQALGMNELELIEDETLNALTPIIQERIKTLTEAAPLVDWAFVPASAIVYDNPELFIPKKMDAAQTAAILRTGLDTLRGVGSFTAEALEAAFRTDTERAGIKVGPWLQPFRVAITGKSVAPPLFESMVILGRAETVLRVENALRALEGATVAA